MAERDSKLKEIAIAAAPLIERQHYHEALLMRRMELRKQQGVPDTDSEGSGSQSEDSGNEESSGDEEGSGSGSEENPSSQESEQEDSDAEEGSEEPEEDSEEPERPPPARAGKKAKAKAKAQGAKAQGRGVGRTHRSHGAGQGADIEDLLDAGANLRGLGAVFGTAPLGGLPERPYRMPTLASPAPHPSASGISVPLPSFNPFAEEWTTDVAAMRAAKKLPFLLPLHKELGIKNTARSSSAFNAAANRKSAAAQAQAAQAYSAAEQTSDPHLRAAHALQAAEGYRQAADSRAFQQHINAMAAASSHSVAVELHQAGDREALIVATGLSQMKRKARKAFLGKALSKRNKREAFAADSTSNSSDGGSGGGSSSDSDSDGGRDRRKRNRLRARRHKRNGGGGGHRADAPAAGERGACWKCGKTDHQAPSCPDLARLSVEDKAAEIARLRRAHLTRRR
ncbi:hypothetical protein GPECTOR_907g164 [Gonium pectorale]|uniref:CCHC-type domain-containing protein n=1 Tax=Gonium pectorale TaxID=33097 RepID=A0A150FTX7_GONPE|nr:hypothetical protein GPECTOR_907g164 [Gonium pectorale]|eukprot:KXZ41046.1 hypothetical protein GPECTOR_907g164 [Gonium pectorale]